MLSAEAGSAGSVEKIKKINLPVFALVPRRAAGEWKY